METHEADKPAGALTGCRGQRSCLARSTAAAPKGRAVATRSAERWYLARNRCWSDIIWAVALSEADTRAKLIDPAIHSRGWTEDLICRETTLGAVEIIAGKARRRSGGRTDYTLRIRVSAESQPVALALLEAKKDTLPPGHGLDQAKGYLRAPSTTSSSCSRPTVTCSSNSTARLE